MARPRNISRLHAAKYDFKYSAPEQKPDKFKSYEKLLKETALEYGTQEGLLKATLEKDFRDWIKENNLPKPPLK